MAILDNHAQQTADYQALISKYLPKEEVCLDKERWREMTWVQKRAFERITGNRTNAPGSDDNK